MLRAWKCLSNPNTEICWQPSKTWASFKIIFVIKSQFAKKSGDFHVFEMQLVMDFQVSCLIRILCLSRQFRSNYILVMGSLFQDVVIVKISVPGGLETLVFVITLGNNFWKIWSYQRMGQTFSHFNIWAIAHCRRATWIFDFKNWHLLKVPSAGNSRILINEVRKWKELTI